LRLSSKEWALHQGLYSGVGSIWRWRVRHGLGQFVTASSDWACCHFRQSQHCVLQGRHPPASSSSSMTIPPAVLLVLCVISCKTGMSVFYHDQRRAQISIPLSMTGTCWIWWWGLGPFPSEMSGNLQVPWWKSGVTSHSKNGQFWCCPWGDALQYLMQLVATPDTDWYFWFWPLCSGTHYSISVSHMFLELVQFMSQVLNLMFIQIFTHVNIAENKRSWHWEDIYFFVYFNNA
jgi:hypothetical protein